MCVGGGAIFLMHVGRPIPGVFPTIEKFTIIIQLPDIYFLVPICDVSFSHLICWSACILWMKGFWVAPGRGAAECIWCCVVWD